MVTKSFYRQLKRRQAGFLLLEAAIAAGFAAMALTIYTSILQKQIDLAKRARDLDMIEMLINEDITAFRHQARLWKMSSGPSYPSLGLNVSDIVTYRLAAGDCYAWAIKGILEMGFRSDLANSKPALIPGTIKLNTPISSDYYQGYTITRTTSAPVNITDVGNTLYVPPESAAYTLRLTYTVTPKSPPGTRLPNVLERVVDVQIPAQFSC